MIPPSLREKRRYIAFRVIAKPVFTQNQVLQGIRQGVLHMLGELGYADSNFEIVFYDHEKMLGIARTRNTRKDDIVVALTMLNSLQGKKASVKVLGISGTVKKAREKFLQENIFKQENVKIYKENKRGG